MKCLVLLLLSQAWDQTRSITKKAHLDRKLKAIKVVEKIAVDGRLKNPLVCGSAGLQLHSNRAGRGRSRD